MDDVLILPNALAERLGPETAEMFMLLANAKPENPVMAIADAFGVEPGSDERAPPGGRVVENRHAAVADRPRTETKTWSPGEYPVIRDVRGRKPPSARLDTQTRGRHLRGCPSHRP